MKNIKSFFSKLTRSVTPRGLAVGIACVAVIVLCLCLIPSCGGNNGENQATETPVSATTTPIAEETPSAQATFRRATLYYLSDEGYIVPVTKLIPWEEGIAKACLSYISSTPDNDAAATAMGLCTVIPAGVQLELSISAEGNATLNLIGLPDMGSAAMENALVAAVVNTLTEFPTISTVSILIDGKSAEALPHGTRLPNGSAAYPLNVENGDVATSGTAFAMRLYFPTASGAYNVPITRYITSAPTLYSCVSGLVNGGNSDMLLNCFPTGTLLLGAAIENGVLTVNFSEDFKQVEAVDGLFALAYETLYLTASDVCEFTSLIIQVNGVVYSPESVSVPLYIND